MQYSTAAVAMPWEVGKLLLQIQHVPQELDDADELIEEALESSHAEQEV
jgi:fusion and transport protein UGO1